MKLAKSIAEELWFEEDASEAITFKASESLASALAESQGLKPFPVVARKLLDLVEQPEFKVDQVTRLIEEDPGLASKLLRMANSALFGMRVPSTSARQAVVRLGAKVLHEQVVSLAFASLFEDASGVGRVFRDHCAGTAAVVRVLARELAPDLKDGIFTAGLLHDIGKLLLIQSSEVPYEDSLSPEQMWAPDQMHLEERRFLGFDHAVLGGHVLANWKIPEPLPRVVAWHHQPTRAFRDPEAGRMVALVRIADWLEPHLKHQPEFFDLDVKQLTDRADFQFAQIEPEAVLDLWVELYAIRNDTMSLFTADEPAGIQAKPPARRADSPRLV